MDRLERLINLIIALRETLVPLTAAEIRERVAGYGQDDHESFRRMFERDKADLRALGVPIELAPLDRWKDRHGYRIDPSRYDLPEIAFTPQELTALAVAVEAAGLQDDGRTGLRKLETGAGMPGLTTDRQPAHLGTSLDLPHRDVLVDAQVTRTTVRFTYRRPGDRPAPRTVDPHALVHRAGRWYVVGHDHDRDARRAFRIDRIEGPVELFGEPEAFPPAPQDIGIDDVVPPSPSGALEMARVAASPDIAWQVARRARGGGRQGQGGWTAYEVVVADPEEFVGWVLRYGPDLEVLEPDDLRQRVRRALEQVAGP